MCTSITYQMTDGTNFLARTMDFGFELEGLPTIFPRNYAFSLDLGGEMTNRYGYVGTGRKLDKYIFADGMNECGLAIAELYFPHEAKYEEKKAADKINLAPHELISWVLGEIGSVSELKERINEVNLVTVENSLLEIVLPLHYIVTDSSGETVVIEPQGGPLIVKNNPVNVMTNSPELEWHVKNMNNYLGIQPQNFNRKQYGSHTVFPFGQGSGTFGLPGGYTSPERFIRATYLREYARKSSTISEAILTILHILGNVTIPQGVNIKEDQSDDYTQYTAIFNTKDKTYYFQPQETNALLSVELKEDYLTQSEPQAFAYGKGLRVEALG